MSRNNFFEACEKENDVNKLKILLKKVDVNKLNVFSEKCIYLILIRWIIIISFI